MARSALSAFVAFASLTFVAGQSTSTTPAAQPAPTPAPATPGTALSNLHFPYTALPYQAMPDNAARGPQSGYNLCNASTENQQSLCQTLIVNNISDFSIFAPPTLLPISDAEGEVVAYSTKQGHGSRPIIPGTLTGVQLLRAKDYIQIVAFLKQENVNIPANDTGGELDGAGQDDRGNPIGALVYSNAFSGDGSYQQTSQWNVFVGSGSVGVKVCNENGPAHNPAGYCQHTLDRIGLAYNMPNGAKDGVFEACDSDNMDVPGVYTSNGQTQSYAQPPESLGAITSIPYTARVPASSNCVTYQSSALYTDFLSLAPTSSGPASTNTPNNAGATRSGSSAGAGATSGQGNGNGAGATTISLFSGILGVAFSVAFLA